MDRAFQRSRSLMLRGTFYSVPPNTMPRSMFMHVCLHEATHMYVRVCTYVCECESYKSPQYKDVFKKDQELFK